MSSPGPQRPPIHGRTSGSRLSPHCPHPPPAVGSSSRHHPPTHSFPTPPRHSSDSSGAWLLQSRVVTTISISTSVIGPSTSGTKPTPPRTVGRSHAVPSKPAPGFLSWYPVPGTPWNEALSSALRSSSGLPTQIRVSLASPRKALARPNLFHFKALLARRRCWCRSGVSITIAAAILEIHSLSAGYCALRASARLSFPSHPGTSSLTPPLTGALGAGRGGACSHAP